jgi:dolichyl-diphosphooligosaccharide--protein glycosyltransferase
MAQEEGAPVPAKPAPDPIRFLKNNWHWAALLLIFLLAFYLRFFPYTTNRYLNLDDPYYLYRMSEYYVQHGSVPAIDYMSYYPIGRPLPLYADQAFLYILVGWIKIVGSWIVPTFTTYQATFLYPAIFGALQVIPMFLLVRVLSKSKVAGLISAAFYGILPASLSRTLAGFGYKEGFGLFFLLFSFYFLVLAIERKNHLFSAASGIFLFMMGLTWGGVQMGQLFLLLYAFSAIILEVKKPVASSSLISCGVSLVLAFLPSPHAFQTTIVTLALFVTALFLAKRYVHRKFGLAHIIVLFVILYFIFPVKVSSLVGYAMNFQIGSAEQGLASTVAQNKLTDWTDFLNELSLGRLSQISPAFPYFGALFISAVGALYIGYEFLLKEKRVDELKLFILLFFLYGVWFGKGGIRLIVGTAIGVSILTGYFLWKLLAKDRRILGVNFKGLFFLVLLIGSFAGHLFIAYSYSTQTRTTMNDYWVQGLEWIKDSSPEGSVVFSWWDYGYIIQAIAERPSVIDPRNLYEERDIEAAKFLTAQSESEPLNYDDGRFRVNFTSALDYLRHYNISYIILDGDMIGKYSAVSKIASHGESVGQYLISPFEGTTCSDASCSRKTSKFGPVELISDGGNSSLFFVQGTQRMQISRVCGTPGDSPCVFLASDAAVTPFACGADGCAFSPQHGNSLFFKMWFLNAAGLDHIKLAYSNPFVKVYQVS